jgi:hypothetical protein
MNIDEGNKIMVFGRRKSVVEPTPEAMPVAPASMVDLRKEASVSLRKHGVDGKGVSVYLVLDHSGSMEGFYQRGDVQRIAEQALALSTEIDDDGQVPVFYFGSEVSQPKTVSLDNYNRFVDRTHQAVEWGATDYDKTIRAVTAYHVRHGGGQPGLVIFQTDGSPGTWGGGDDRENARQALRDVSGQDIFFSFVGFGPKRQVSFLFELDEIGGRVRDNASAFHAKDPQRVKDSDLYDGILKEFTQDWLPQVLR